MKNYLILVGLAAILLAAGFTDARYSGGTGEQSNPYRIANAKDLSDIGKYEEDWDKHFVLINDVNLAEYTGTQFRTIGWLIDEHHYKPFTGVFDGNDHKIWNFTWHSTDADCIGLFGFVEEPAQIKNLGLENVDVNVINGMYVGGLVGGNAAAEITNCYSTGSVTGDEEVGGLIGENDGTITNCYSTASVSGFADAGGLVGSNFEGQIANCHSTSSVWGQWCIGGLVGINADWITNCYSKGNVSGTWAVGGLAGANGSIFAKISSCYSSSIVSGDERVGGLVGSNAESRIDNCHSSARASGGKYVGGLVGFNGGYEFISFISNCYSTGTVSGTTLVGGLVGHNIDVVRASFWDVNTSSQSTSSGGTPKTTAQMKTKSTFTSAGWDFVNIWDICEGTNYPRFIWQILVGDFACPDGVDFIDFAILASAWQSEPNEPNWMPACDISEPKDYFIDGFDLAIFCENWLKGE
jgi:hypothetical protein